MFVGAGLNVTVTSVAGALATSLMSGDSATIQDTHALTGMGVLSFSLSFFRTVLSSAGIS